MERLRLAELLAGLSLLADTGMGLDPGQAARTALLACPAGSSPRRTSSRP